MFETTDPAVSTSGTPCSDCHAGCCRAFAVPITGSDVMRLERAGHNFWSFACRWEDPSGAIAGRFAPHIRFADEPATPFVMCLLQEASTLFPGTQACHFLKETSNDELGESATSHCSVYESRPTACKVFPVKFDASRELVQLQPVIDPPRAAESEAYKLCPRPWKARDVDGVEAAQALATAEYEIGFFTKVVQLWNQKPGDWMAFPKFLRLVYGSRVEVIERSSDVEPVILPIGDYRDRNETAKTDNAPAANKREAA